MRFRNILFGAALGTIAGVTISRTMRWQRTWGVDPADAGKALPGDDIVPEPVAIETRSIEIDAPPETIWPWLVQMGYGRAGWYSYDRLDQRGQSAYAIVDAWQTLKVGDIVPTHPDGGFEVVRLTPGSALVLRSDTDLVRRQSEAATGGPEESKVPVQGTPGVALSGAILSSTPQQFAASWAFVLEPVDGGRTRLIERFRVWYGAGSPASRFVMPFVGFGVFVMMQKQMRELKTRAEWRVAGTAAPTGRDGHDLPVDPVKEVVGATT